MSKNPVSVVVPPSPRKRRKKRRQKEIKIQDVPERVEGVLNNALPSDDILLEELAKVADVDVTDATSAGEDLDSIAEFTSDTDVGASDGAILM
jgi:hypothetical protein